MNILLIIIGFGFGILIVFLVYRIVALKFEKKRHYKLQYSRVRELDIALNENRIPKLEFLKDLAKSNLSRVFTYEILKRHNKEDLFPKEYYSKEYAAEGHLVNWLEFPTELNKAPDVIELVDEVSITVGNDLVHYFVFRFKTYEPHWNAKNGWVLGVVGPYFKDSKPFDFPIATFSRLLKNYENITSYDEAKWVHENITKKKNTRLDGLLKVEKLTD